jgi:hypothetical protein
LGAAQLGIAQLGHTTKKDKGPRAVGLVELSSDGKARLIPVAIMIDGKFYDASAYKASPVPMAIWGETVYEAERTGVSQGLFTVNEAVRAGSSWSANGKWVPAGSKPAKKHTETKPRFEEDSGPPKLRRSGSEPTPPSDSAPTTKGPPDAKNPPDTTPPDTKTPEDTKTQPAPSAPTTPSSPPPQSSPPAPTTSTSDDDEGPAKPAAPGNTTSNDEDPNRPVLARGKIESLGSTQHPSPGAKTSTAGKSAAGSGKDAAGKSADTKSSEKKSGPQLIPAVSDTGGPDPRPYAYDLKPDEEQKVRKKMLAMVSDLIVARAKPSEASTTPAKTTSPKTTTPANTATRSAPAHRAAKPPQVSFDDVQFHAFDLWNTNEPIFVMSAKAHLPPGTAASPDSDFAYFITLVVKEDIYGDLRKLNATLTDTRHLDETPRMELIDAVDADGDGRGELLFREISDAGSVYSIYRAGADQLFPLFQGTR